MSARPHVKELSTFMPTKQFQRVSTVRLHNSSNWRWYLLQRIVYCSHITLFHQRKDWGPLICWGPLAVAQSAPSLIRHCLGARSTALCMTQNTTKTDFTSEQTIHPPKVPQTPNFIVTQWTWIPVQTVLHELEIFHN